MAAAFKNKIKNGFWMVGGELGTMSQLNILYRETLGTAEMRTVAHYF